MNKLRRSYGKDWLIPMSSVDWKNAHISINILTIISLLFFLWIIAVSIVDDFSLHKGALFFMAFSFDWFLPIFQRFYFWIIFFIFFLCEFSSSLRLLYIKRNRLFELAGIRNLLYQVKNDMLKNDGILWLKSEIFEEISILNFILMFFAIKYFEDFLNHLNLWLFFNCANFRFCHIATEPNLYLFVMVKADHIRGNFKIAEFFI